MRQSDRQKINRIKSDISEGNLPRHVRDNLLESLDKTAEAVNGGDEPASKEGEALLSLAFCIAGLSAALPGIVSRAIKGNCGELTKMQMLLQILMQPWPWLALAVGIFSPHAPSIITAIRSAIAG